MKVNIRYIHTGLIKADLPDNIDKNDKKAIRDWADNILENTSNKDLLEGMANIGGNDYIEERLFDEVPYAEAVESDDDYEFLMQTKLWRAYDVEADEIVED